MYDFLKVTKTFIPKLQRYTYKPSFQIKPRMKDLMVRSRDFYALYNEKTGMWITDESEAIELIDGQVYDYVINEVGDLINDPEHGPIVLRISDTDTKVIDAFHKFCQRDVRDNYHPVNQKIIFSNSEFKREDYVTYKLSYPLIDGQTPYYDKLMDRLYLPEEQEKFEWAVGAIIAGDQKKIQKLFVFYGPPGSGKSTVIDKIIVDTVFGGSSSPYCSKFTAELLGNRNEFGTDFLSCDPVVAFDDDADLSRIESNTTLNLIVSHEPIRVNAKFRPPFTASPGCFLFCGTNEAVQLSPNSGLNRRLIDIRQTGEKLPPEEYDECVDHLKFEASGIAYKCLNVYKSRGKNYYNHYAPQDMLLQTSPFHNFVKDNYFELKDGITLAKAYKLYCDYAEETNLKTIVSRYRFRDSLKLYFDDYNDQIENNGSVNKNFFSGFKVEKIGLKKEEPKEIATIENSPNPNDPYSWLKLIFDESNFDKLYADSPAQYAKEDGTPQIKWAEVTTTLKDLDTTKLHYVKVPKTHIVIDLDLKDENGEKSFEKNYAAAIQFPPTYAELSKSGNGIHLHYIWTGGDPEELSRVFDNNVEVKVFVGNAALRRKLTKCNDLPIAELSSGLPLKEVEEKVVDKDAFKGERWLRAMIIKNLKKEIHPATKPSIDFIDHLLKTAYASGKDYDVSDLYQPVLIFAMNSTHKAEYCTRLVDEMPFKSRSLEEPKENYESEEYKEAPIIILDIESYPEDKEKNMEALLVVCWKYLGEDKPVVTLENPAPDQVKYLFNFRIVGHNVRDYDAHILYARSQGMTIAECNRISQRIINSVTSDEKRKAKFREAFNIPYADTYDFAAASNKMGLKKWEIKLGQHHQEMGIPWDKAVPKDLWPKVEEYCANDVIATEAVWNYLQPDFMAREILAELSGKTIIDTTNQHTTALLTEGISDPQKDYIYTDLSTIFPGYEFNQFGIDKSRYKEGAKIVSGKSIYKGIDPGEGGRKIGYPGMYTNVGLFDVASMHPSSMIKLNIFGDVITKRLENLVKGRIAIKHKDYNLAISLLGEKVRKYLTGDEATLKKNAKALANALKTAINSVYGLTSASFNNKLKDPRNVDNIVAKYGALFMIDLEEELTNMGYKVVHVSTDSIKVANVDLKVANYIMKRGKEMGFDFEWEAIYEKMTLVNDAVYIAKFMDPDKCKELYGFTDKEVPGDNVDAKEAGEMWSATGKQFQIPYVFKTLFSHKEIEVKDMCETFNVQKGALYLDFNENLPEDQHDYQFIGKIGQFTPVKDGNGGGILYRVDDGKYSAATGTKKPGGKTSYRWLESESILDKDKDYISSIVDKSYYAKLVDDAVSAISEYGDFEWFVGDFMNPPMNESMDEEVPFV